MTLMAERVRFELTNACASAVFKFAAPSMPVLGDDPDPSPAVRDDPDPSEEQDDYGMTFAPAPWLAWEEDVWEAL